MSYTVQCFKSDSWEEVDVFSLEKGDIYKLRGDTFVVSGKPIMEDGQPVIPSSIYESGAIEINFSKGREFIYMVMDYVDSPATDFKDGTMQICSLDGTGTNVYSPRLPVSELNAFCKQHLARYENFFRQNETAITSGKKVAMAKFW
ncbi:hypothetical protein ACOJUY_004314 [Vibrio alginolyticus]|uniref:hypothetical protein n=1 Tax=Vibrio diabolicus TaxID=50719 RepID=UPI00211CA3F6|nr:hypothetical protein [Vibrio diabolicus]EGR3042381.1 hypothetical protein [Vibrio parahaemolyticus]MCQ9247837.1 hypothetical protein [Vibrio diabolicus]